MTTNINSKHRTLVFAHNLAEGRGGWSYDEYYTDAVCHYGEEGHATHSLLVGCLDSSVYQMTGTKDGGTAFTCNLRTASENQGDSRLYKLYGDVALDIDTNDGDVTATIGYDDHSSTDTAETVSTSSRSIHPIDPDAWTTAKNVSLDVSWESDQTAVKLYSWEPRWHEESSPISAYSWSTSEINFGLPGFVYSGYIYLPHISTANLTLTFTIDGTDHAVTIAHGSGTITKTFQRLPVMKGKLWKLTITSSAEFRIAGQQAELLVKAWGTNMEWRRVPLFVDTATSELSA